MCILSEPGYWLFWLFNFNFINTGNQTSLLLFDVIGKISFINDFNWSIAVYAISSAWGFSVPFNVDIHQVSSCGKVLELNMSVSESISTDFFLSTLDDFKLVRIRKIIFPSSFLSSRLIKGSRIPHICDFLPSLWVLNLSKPNINLS